MLLACAVNDGIHCSAMKIDGLVVWGCLLLAGQVQAQVVNDSCPSAQDLDLIIFSPSCYVSGSPAQLVVDSTDLAVPNFPYPSHPGPCFGYSAVPNVPANDRWYRFLLSSNHSVDYTCTAQDSLQLSWWQGYDCAYLIPLDCSTLLPGETIQRSRPGAYHPGIDTLYLQVASTSVSSSARYELCYREEWGTGPITYGTTTPTPVLCLDHAMNIVSASDAFTADGQVQVTVVAGNGAFNILWDDGNTDFLRVGLLTGSYPYVIGDANNCQLHDTAFVQFNGSTGLSSNSLSEVVDLAWDDGWLYCTVRDQALAGRVVLMDALGRVLFSSNITVGRQRLLSSGSISSPLCLLIITKPDGSLRMVHRTLVPITP